VEKSALAEAVVYIGEGLRRLRESRAPRQEDLAELADVGKNTVNRIEKNHTEPHMTTIRKLADALEVDPRAGRGLTTTLSNCRTHIPLYRALLDAASKTADNSGNVQICPQKGA
jgi:transcriptional regulator with XRE-family HTH domain